MYGGKMISVMQYLELSKSYSTSLQFVADQEQIDIISLKEKLIENYQTKYEENTAPKKLFKVFIKPEIKLQKRKI